MFHRRRPRAACTERGEPAIDTLPPEPNPYRPPERNFLVTGAADDVADWDDRAGGAAKASLIALVLLTAADAIGLLVSEQYSWIETLISLAMAFTATNWAVADARRRDRNLHPVVRLIFFLTWPLASLVYLVATRKLRGFGWWLLWVLVLVGTSLATLFAAMAFWSLAGWIDGIRFP